MSVRVRTHTRKRPFRPRSETERKAAFDAGAIMMQYPEIPAGLAPFVDDVRKGLRNGYTWTRNWKFDIDDPKSMEQVYRKLGNRQMYVVATTNVTLEQRRLAGIPKIGANEGVGLWRAPDGTVFMDDIVLFFGPKVSEFWALNVAQRHGQESILQVDGETRTFKFLEVPKWPN